MFGLLREIRAAARYLQNTADDALAQASKLDPTTRDAFLAAALDAALLTRVDGVISGGLSDIKQVFGADVTEYEWCSDKVITIELTWKDVGNLWPPTKMPFEQAQPRLAEIGAVLDQIIYQCESLTLSPSINDAMDNLRTGQPLDLDFEFGPDLPKSEELKNRLFQELAQESKVIVAGVVDAGQRVIYKAASSRAVQRWSVVQLGVAWLVIGLIAVGIVVIAGNSLGHATAKNLGNMLANYVALSVGSGAHLLVEALKAERAQAKPSFQAMHDWILWLHVREYQVLWGFAWLGLGYVLITIGANVTALQLYSAFFAGYSIDSLTEVFLQRFSATVKTKTEALLKVAQ
jgi:hypothetical protein